MISKLAVVSAAPTSRMALAPFVLTLVLAATFALAHEGATGVVKERMELMKRQQKDAKLIGDMAKGKTKFDAAKAADAARDLELTSKKIPELFPEGTSGKPSEALPEIWQDWDKFTGDAKDLETLAGGLAAAITGSGDWKVEFTKLTDACKSCHESFRVKDEPGHKHH